MSRQWEQARVYTPVAPAPGPPVGKELHEMGVSVPWAPSPRPSIPGQPAQTQQEVYYAAYSY